MTQQILEHDMKREGRAEGRKEGRKEERIEIAKNAKAALEKGLDIKEIMAQITGLSVEKINELTI